MIMQETDLKNLAEKFKAMGIAPDEL